MSPGEERTEWESIERLCALVPESFKETNFDPAPHVSEVLNARDPPVALAQLREWHSTLEAAVGQVVSTHHASFSRSIQNYADIVHLFERTQCDVGSLRATFDETRTKFAAATAATGAGIGVGVGVGACRDRGGGAFASASTASAVGGVDAAWSQCVVLNEVARCLDEVERLTRAPKKIRALLSHGKHLPAAVLAMQTCEKLASPEYAVVELALRDLRRECEASREIVRNNVYTELAKTIFCRRLKCRRASESLWTRGVSERNRENRIWGEYGYKDLKGGDGDDIDKSTAGDFRLDETEEIYEEEEEEEEEEFLSETGREAQEQRRVGDAEHIDHLTTCILRLGDVSRTHETLQHAVYTEIFELVRDELLHCRARKDVLASLAAKKSRLADEDKDEGKDKHVIIVPHENKNNAEGGFPVAELVIDHIFCLFRLVLSNLTRLETGLGKHETTTMTTTATTISGVEEGDDDKDDALEEVENSRRDGVVGVSLVTSATHAMEMSFLRAIEGLLLRGDGCAAESGEVRRRVDSWSAASLEGGAGASVGARGLAHDTTSSEDEDTSEIPTFVFYRGGVEEGTTRNEHRGGGGGESTGHTSGIQYGGGRGRAGGGRERNGRSREANHDAVYVAAQHLQAALGISTLPHLGHFDVHLVRELLAEITPHKDV